MIFKETKLEGAFVIEPERIEDDRGFFARVFDKKILEGHGLKPEVAQCNISFNKRRGTLRGMHYQLPPYEEVKIVKCTKGRIFDVIIDIRANSKTFKQWFGIEISEENRKMLYVPGGFAHGYVTLENNCEIFYQVSEFYTPKSERGIRWDDKTFNIEWPVEPIIISEKDRSWKPFTG